MPGHVHRYSLDSLSPGNYDIYMEANTNGGTGAAGQPANVHIGGDRAHTQRLTAKQVHYHMYIHTLQYHNYIFVYVCEGSEEVSIVMGVILPLVLTSLALVLMACLAQNKRYSLSCTNNISQ